MKTVFLEQAEFNPAVRMYWLITGALVFIASIVGIPLLLLYVPIAWFFTGIHFDRLRCRMTEKFLKVEKGVWERVEKNVPLEQITDMAIVEGPLMRLLGVKCLTVETAGQSENGALVKLYGIKEVELFRDRVLAQRELIRLGHQKGAADLDPGQETQKEILASLQRIEVLLEAQSVHESQAELPTKAE